MRGPLDDALAKMARRDELRRRAAGEPAGTPPAVTELVEAIATVVDRHPGLGVSVGVEGAGEPLLLHFYYSDGQVQVNAENAPPAGSGSGARHADVVVEAEPYTHMPYAEAPAQSPYAENPYAEAPAGRDDQDRYGAPVSGDPYRHAAETFDYPTSPAGDYAEPGESSRDLGARLRNLGMASSRPDEYPPHPFAATPPPPVPPPAPQAVPQPATVYPPVPPQAAPPRSGPPQSGPPQSGPPQSGPPQSGPPQSGPPRSAPPQSAPPRTGPPQSAPPPAAAGVPPQRSSGGMPAPLPQPIPLQVERPEETELAARRLTALLRDDPSLLARPQD